MLQDLAFQPAVAVRLPGLKRRKAKKAFDELSLDDDTLLRLSLVPSLEDVDREPSPMVDAIRRYLERLR